MASKPVVSNKKFRKAKRGSVPQQMMNVQPANVNADRMTTQPQLGPGSIPVLPQPICEPTPAWSGRQEMTNIQLMKENATSPIIQPQRCPEPIPWIPQQNHAAIPACPGPIPLAPRPIRAATPAWPGRQQVTNVHFPNGNVGYLTTQPQRCPGPIPWIPQPVRVAIPVWPGRQQFPNGLVGYLITQPQCSPGPIPWIPQPIRAMAPACLGRQQMMNAHVPNTNAGYLTPQPQRCLGPTPSVSERIHAAISAWQGCRQMVQVQFPNQNAGSYMTTQPQSSLGLTPLVPQPQQIPATSSGLPMFGQAMEGWNQGGQVTFQEPVTVSSLAAASTQEQKHMLGSILFRYIQNFYPYLAGEITEMLLEIDSSDIILMMENRELLSSKIEEAVAALKHYYSQ